MSWGKRYPSEQLIARHALLSTSNATAVVLSSFVGWLLSVSGASFALLIANLDKISPFVSLRSFKWALAWFTISMFLGLLSRWIGSNVAAALAAISAIEDRARSLDTPHDFNLLAFTKLFGGGLLLPYRCLAWRGFRLSRTGDLISGIKVISYQSQIQAILVLGQIAFLFIAVAVLAHGIKT